MAINLGDALVLAAAIHSGDIPVVRGLLTTNPVLATEPLGGPLKTRTALHVVADWPGYFPNGAEIVRVLLEFGADPNAHDPGGESPLHWAASSDDADVARALIDAGADIEAPEGSIGTPLDNAIGYACWDVARLLVQRGASVTKLWHASALGLLLRLEELLAEHGDGDEEALSQAFWHACAGGQRRAAELLLSRGADINWMPDYSRQTALEVAAAPGTRRENVVNWLRERGARSSA